MNVNTGLSLILICMLASCMPSDEKKEVLKDPSLVYKAYDPKPNDRMISRAEYANKLHGFWLGQCIANWTGLVTEMDKIGGDGINGRGAGFYTRENWGGPDFPNIWEVSAPDSLSSIITFIFEDENGVWGADDDTDVEYLYQYITYANKTSILTAEQIRDGWLTHIYSEENTPFIGADGISKENYLWVSNQEAHNLMLEGYLPPATSDPENNPFYEMIDAQLTTEIFGFFSPARPDVALKIAHLPIQTTARMNAEWISEFYVIMYSLASEVSNDVPINDQLVWMADQARKRLPDDSYSSTMYDFVKAQYLLDMPWELVRDSLHVKYQVNQEDGYEWATKDQVCHGCFAAGINFGASIISLFYGEGDLKETIKIGALAGWDSDNPTATWGGLLGFMLGKDGVEHAFNRQFSEKFFIHRTRGGFPEAIDTFSSMAEKGVFIVDRVVQEEMGGGVDLNSNVWYIPETSLSITPGK